MFSWIKGEHSPWLRIQSVDIKLNAHWHEIRLNKRLAYRPLRASSMCAAASLSSQSSPNSSLICLWIVSNCTKHEFINRCYHSLQAWGSGVEVGNWIWLTNIYDLFLHKKIKYFSYYSRLICIIKLTKMVIYCHRLHVMFNERTSHKSRMHLYVLNKDFHPYKRPYISHSQAYKSSYIAPQQNHFWDILRWKPQLYYTL